MNNRRGVALLAALWLVVAIATVALSFALEARERRTLGIQASERGIQRAAAMGALAMTEAKLDYALRVAPSGSNIQRLAASDPWLGVDSTYSGTIEVDSMPVEIVAHDLGEKLNINRMTENDLKTFFSYLLGDFAKARELSQTIMDWRDADSIPRPQGAEHDAYIKAEMLALPTNSSFRDLSELQNVMGMTAEIYAAAAPYLTTIGSGTVNINSAPIPVLRALPGMTDALMNQIVMMRSQGRRIDGLGAITQTRNGRPLPGQLSQGQLQNAFNGRVVYTTTEVELDITSRVSPQAQPSKLTVVLSRGNANAGSNITYKQW